MNIVEMIMINNNFFIFVYVFESIVFFVYFRGRCKV